jgi:hypothetical protein
MADRISLTGQLVRPAHRHLRQTDGFIGITRRNALATSPGFSILPDVSRPSDGPRVDLARWVLCGIPSAWRSPTTRCPEGNILSQPPAELARLCPRGSAW